ncbi:hypothetical protein DITRI_Ditri13aG0047000 [Diplodiscus trichospermus]
MRKGDNEVDGLGDPRATFLTELNLLIVAFSLISSMGNDDCLNLVGINQGKKGKACVPRLHAKKRETNELKLMRRQTQRSTQPTPKDIREGFGIAFSAFYAEAGKCVSIVPCSLLTHKPMNEELKATAFTRKHWKPWEDIMDSSYKF